MSGRITVLAAENQTLSTGSVLMAFRTAAAAAAAARVTVKRLEISQSGSTTLAMIRGEMATRDTAGTLTMTATTPRNIRPLAGPSSGLTGNTAPVGGDGRSGTTSTADSGGAYTSIYPFNFANTAGYLWKPDPDEEVVVPASTVFVVRFVTAPGTLTGWTFSLILNEE